MTQFWRILVVLTLVGLVASCPLRRRSRRTPPPSTPITIGPVASWTAQTDAALRLLWQRDPGQASALGLRDFDRLLANLQELLAEVADFLEPIALGSTVPEADAVVFPQLFGDPCQLTAQVRGINLPLLVGENGLPIGVQLIGAAEEDDRLLRTAKWMLNELQSDLA